LRAIIDILFKDITYYIGVNIFTTRLDTCIQMPVPLVKEIKQAFKCLVLYLYVGKFLFNNMNIKQSPVKIWNFTKLNFQFFTMHRCTQTFMEQRKKEITVE